MTTLHTDGRDDAFDPETRRRLLDLLRGDLDLNEMFDECDGEPGEFDPATELTV